MTLLENSAQTAVQIGRLDRQSYAAAIPPCCSYRTIEEHEAIMLCWGLADALKRGEVMECGACPQKLPTASVDN